MAKLTSEQQRLVRESGYAGVICGIGLCFLLTRGQTLVGFESLLPPVKTIKLSVFVGWLSIPVFSSAVFAAAARTVIYKFVANDTSVPLVPFARAIGGAKALAVLAAAYYFTVRPTLQGESPMLTQGLVCLVVVHLLAIAGKTWVMVSRVALPE